MKRVLLLVVTVLGVLLHGAAIAQTTLNLWITGPGYDRFLKQVVPLFEAQNPGVKVEWLNLGWDNYQQKILTGFSGGASPDVFSFYSVDVAPWASRGMLKNLDPVVTKEDFIPAAIENGIYDGKVFAIPLGMRPRPLFYRKDFLAEKGFKGPPQNWTELKQFAQATARKDGAGLSRVGFWVPTGHPYKTPQTWLAFLWNAGGEVFTPDGKAAAFNSPEGVRATEFLASMLKEGLDAPGSIKADNVDFAQGKVSMLLSNIVARGLDLSNAEALGRLGVAPPPRDKRQQMELAGEMLGISSATKNAAGAEKLARFLALNAETATAYALHDNTMPALKAVAASPKIVSHPIISNYVALAQYGRPLPVHPRWPEVSDVLTKALDEVYLQGRPAKAALDGAAERVNRILAR